MPDYSAAYHPIRYAVSNFSADNVSATPCRSNSSTPLDSDQLQDPSLLPSSATVSVSATPDLSITNSQDAAQQLLHLPTANIDHPHREVIAVAFRQSMSIQSDAMASFLPTFAIVDPSPESRLHAHGCSTVIAKSVMTSSQQAHSWPAPEAQHQLQWLNATCMLSSAPTFAKHIIAKGFFPIQQYQHQQLRTTAVIPEDFGSSTPTCWLNDTSDFEAWSRHAHARKKLPDTGWVTWHAAASDMLSAVARKLPGSTPKVWLQSQAQVNARLPLCLCATISFAAQHCNTLPQSPDVLCSADCNMSGWGISSWCGASHLGGAHVCLAFLTLNHIASAEASL